MRRKVKPKVLVLSQRSVRSVSRLAAALAFTTEQNTDMPATYNLRRRAEQILDLLREMS